MPRVTITVPDKNSQPYRFQLDRQVVTLGRGLENDIAIDSGSVSVNHAEMHRIAGGYELRDVGSTNGIKLNGVRQEVIPLSTGASVRIGDVAFDFVLSDEELAVLAGETPAAGPAQLRESELPAAPEVARPAPAVAKRPAPASSGFGFGAAAMFLVLAGTSFFAGLAIRHQKDTGISLLDAMRKAPAPQSAPAAPATPEAPASSDSQPAKAE